MNKKTIKGIKAKRSVHLIDIENLCISGDLSVQSVREAKEDYFAQIKPGDDDLFYIAASHHNMQATLFGWGTGAFEFRSGKDGADLLIAEAMASAHLSERFAQVYIASGDGGLAPWVMSLVSQGSTVNVVTRIECVSMAMRFATDSVIYLKDTHALAA